MKIVTNQPDQYIIPLDANYQYPDYFMMLYWKSDALQTTMTLDGTINNYIGYAQAPFDTWCWNDGTTTSVGSFGGDQLTLTNTEEWQAWSGSAYMEFYGRPCFTPTGVSPYCTLVDGSFKNSGSSTHPVAYATTQDRYYNELTYHEIGIFETADSTAHITYPNGDGTQNGKVITVQHTYDMITTNDIAKFSTLPGWGSGREYSKTFYNYVKTYHEVTTTQTTTTGAALGPTQCDGNS